MSTIAPGNKTHIFPEAPPTSTEARENSIVSRTREQMFEESPAINNPAATHGGGIRNTFQAMAVSLSGKLIQETYRVGFSRSQAGHDRVSDR
ncbi:MAG: hypothetical protein J2P13_12900 [Acidobacteria bacterium]|nr:hypothetical protein [Acidobacteriota bacterium]